ncbi:MAG: cell division protein FtsZ [SAR202 cluster bacterium]|nr:cell division protein FtsZ [SAR202 cluster bacterium]|tara:strand:- start:125 stop:1237 length:1113 start_codon:yes stop_codon:yes gene_type:complete
MVDQTVNKTEEKIGSASIKVVGVGGGGSNAVSRMYRDRIPEVEYISVNTDAQALTRSDVPVRIRVGDSTARGLGVGGDPSKGRECHEEDRDEIKRALEGADLIFIAAGMGGGTGTGGSPVVAEVAQELGALTVGVVTKPFNFEGSRRSRQAEEGIRALSDVVDTLIVIPNDRLLIMSNENLSMDMAFRMADDVLRQGVQAIAELILMPGEINLDFADAKAIMSNAGPAWMAIGHGTGEDRAIMAAEAAIDSPLLEVSIEGARGVIFNVTGGSDLTLQEVQQASEVVSSMVDPDCNIIFGMVTDPKMENEVKMTIIATGFPGAEASQEKEAAVSAVLSDVLSDQEALDLPPFLRHHRAARSRSVREVTSSD